jgi:hypothetical protein
MLNLEAGCVPIRATYAAPKTGDARNVERPHSMNGSSVVLAQISRAALRVRSLRCERLGVDASPLGPMILTVMLADLRPPRH